MKLKMKILALFIICAMSSFNVQSQQDGFLGEVKMFAGNFAPRGWALCEGQVLPVNQNQALYSLLGITYGGDGRTTFALPDLRSRVAVGNGRGPGLLNYRLGQKGGAENNTLIVNQLPSHTHLATGTVTPNASTEKATSDDPTGKYPSAAVYPVSRAELKPVLTYGDTTNAKMGSNPVNVTVSNTGGNQAINNIQPYISINYIICINGTFPSRN
jgi:microcystin-dependent protein